MINLRFKNIAIAALLFSGAAGISGCASDTPLSDDSAIEVGVPTEISLSIRSIASNSIGDGVPSDPETKYEKINSWWLVFADRTGKVMKIISRNEAVASVTSEVEEETFRCTVPSGVYDIYAFANIDAETLTSATGIEFNPGEKINLPTGVSKIEEAIWEESLNNWPADKLLPMSGLLKGVRIKNNIEEHFSIEVVRMMAKMEFLFSNIDSEDITIHSISVDPVTTSSISLFPIGAAGAGYSHLGIGPYTPLDPENTTYGKLTIPISSGNVVKPGKENAQAISFYLQESLSDRANNEAFTIGINVSHGNGETLFEQYNITNDILSYINRNDHIFIPITLSQYDIDVDALFYPPIGGYPAVSSANDPEGAQIFTFGSEGDFSVVAHVTDKDAATHLAPDYYAVGIKDISDPSGIFTTGGAPEVESFSPSLPEEITGILSKNTGKASFTITVDIYDAPKYQTGVKVKTAYSRKIFIIRE